MREVGREEMKDEREDDRGRWGEVVRCLPAMDEMLTKNFL